MKVIFFLFCFLLPSLCFAKGSITLTEISTTSTQSVYALEAHNIDSGLIGVSTVINLFPGIHFEKFSPGNFWASSPNANIQYLIAPKTTDPSKLVLGIASLGAIPAQGSGLITTLYFQKSPSSTQTIMSLANSVSSGIQNGLRQDFADIPWSLLPTNLSSTGPQKSLPIAITCFLIALLITIRLKTFKKMGKIWYNYLKTHKNKYVPTQKNHSDQEKSHR